MRWEQCNATAYSGAALMLMQQGWQCVGTTVEGTRTVMWFRRRLKR